MPNRILKESIKSSPQIDQLSWFEEVVFYRLMVSADDYGCMDGRIVLLKNELFPTKDTVTKKAVEDAIARLASVGLLCKYTVNGMPYLFFPTWEKHQRIRNKHRKYPEPTLDSNSLSNDGQMTASCQSESNPIQIESNIESKSKTDAHPRSFDLFWNAYPKKVGKEAARKAFAKVKVDTSVLIRAIEQQKNSAQWQKDNGQYIPNPATWLNQGRWEDELTTSPTQVSMSYGDRTAEIARMRKMLEDA